MACVDAASGDGSGKQPPALSGQGNTGVEPGQTPAPLAAPMGGRTKSKTGGGGGGETQANQMLCDLIGQ